MVEPMLTNRPSIPILPVVNLDRARRFYAVNLGLRESRKVLDLLMRLESEARAAGGAVHVVLGNHEVMNIAGDLRYVSTEEYATQFEAQ